MPAAPRPPMSAAPEARSPRPWRDLGWWGQVALTYAVALAGGALAARAGVPLAWMLGPFFACGLVSLAGGRMRPLPHGREAAQLTIGLGIGLRFTEATLIATLALIPAMLGATVYVIAYTLLAAFLFAPLARVSGPTAFFATAAGGVADMAVIARQKGGDAPAVGIVHALRVSTTVATVPLLVIAFGQPGTAIDVPPPQGAALLWLLPVFAGAVLVARLLRRTSLPNPWLVGAMALGLVLGASGLLRTGVPWPLIVAAQLFLGTWLGSQFRRELLLTLPRVALAGIAISLFMIAAAFLGAVVLSGLTGLPVSTAFLALAPAAVTEMVITAKTMHLDPEVITGFHVMRIFLVLATVTQVYRLYALIASRLGRG